MVFSNGNVDRFRSEVVGDRPRASTSHDCGKALNAGDDLVCGKRDIVDRLRRIEPVDPLGGCQSCPRTVCLHGHVLLKHGHVLDVGRSD